MARRLLILVAACGGGGGSKPPDASVPLGTIRVGAPSGAHVLFRGADGVVQDVIAGADGFASVMADGEFEATVLASATKFLGFEGLHPGDTVVPPPGRPPIPPNRTSTVVIPRYEDATQYSIRGSDGASGFLMNTSDSPTVDGVISESDAPLANDATLVVTTTAMSGDAYSFVEHADLTGETVVFPALQPTPTVTLTVTGRLPSVATVGMSIIRYASSDALNPLAISNLQTNDDTTYRGKIAPVGLAVVQGGFLLDSNIEIRYVAYSKEPYTVDASQMLHGGSNAKWIGTKAAWEETSEGVDPLLAQVVFTYEDKQITVVAPYTGPAMTLPPLPDTVDTTDTSTIRVVGASTMSFAPGTSYVDAIPQLAHPRWQAVILE